MDDIIVNLESLLSQFQSKFLEIEGILHNTNKQFNRLKAEYVKCDNAEESVMSMKDFVSYMSALEEAEDTSHNISEIPLDNDNISRDNSEAETEVTPVPPTNEETMSVPAEKPRTRTSSMTMSNSFGCHEVIQEEEEVEEDKNMMQVDDDKPKTDTAPEPLPVWEKTRKKLPRPTSLTNVTVQQKNDVKPAENRSKSFEKLARPTSIISNKKKRIVNNTNNSHNKKINSAKPTNLDFVNIR